VKTLEDLQRAAETGRISAVQGFGETTQRRILEAVSERRQSQRRVRLNIAAQVADSLLSELRQVPGVKQAEPAGSLRRGRDTVGDLDLLVAAGRNSAVMACRSPRRSDSCTSRGRAAAPRGGRAAGAVPHRRPATP
jgi:DNA polymerase (family 10)